MRANGKSGSRKPCNALARAGAVFEDVHVRGDIGKAQDNTPAGAAESRQSQEPRIMGIFRSFDGAC